MWRRSWKRNGGRPEGGEGLVGERHVAGAAGLRKHLDAIGERAADDEDAVGPADVVPPQEHELAAAQAASRWSPARGTAAASTTK